jgi:uncharacterized protein (DUF58 family)
VIIVLATAVCTFVFSSRYILILLAADIILPLASQLLLVRETKGMSVDIAVESGITAGKMLDMTITITQPHRRIASSIVICDIKRHNVMFRAERVERIRINLKNGVTKHTERVKFNLCGEVSIGCVNLRCCDLFGIGAVSVNAVCSGRITVNPSEIPLNVVRSRNNAGAVDGSVHSQNRTGRDMSEIYDLREYVPGDDMRMIHWKLSEKVNTPIMKEPSSPSTFYLMMIFDAGLNCGENPISRTQISVAAELFIAISERLTESGTSHCVGITVGDRLEFIGVESRADFYRMRDKFLSLPLPEQPAEAIRYFSVSEKRHDFSKLVYVCPNDFPDESLRVSDEINLTVLCVCDDKEFNTVMGRNSIISKIPVTDVKEKVHNVIV